MGNRTLAATASLLAFTALSMGSPAWAQPAAEPSAQGDEGEIVITAQRREERQVDVPITVTNLSEETLQTANVQELTDITKITSGLRFDFAGGFFTPTIRGVGTSVVTSGGQGNVGIYVDGFYSPNPLATDIQLMNVRNIQVLKGPQGTLFGRNTTGGAILVQTADPSTDTSAEFKVSLGRFNEARLQGYATFGLTDKIAFDVEALYRQGDGWQRDISLRRHVGAYDNWSVRFGLKADLSDSISVLLRWQHSITDDPSPLLTASYRGEIVPGSGVVESGAPAFAAPGQFTFNRREIASGSDPEFFHANADVFQGTIKADLGFADLTSYTQYRSEKVDSSIELDYSGADIFQLGLPNLNKTISQEFLLTSQPGPKLQWTAGLFFFSNRDTYLVFVDNFPAIGINNTRVRSSGSSTTTKTYAAFADATYEVNPKLFITAGLRYAYDKITDAYYYQFLGFPNKIPVTPAQYDAANDGRLTPRVVIRYKPTDNSSVYASYTKGYKAALLDVGGATGNPVAPEKITAYEVGFKHADRKLQAEVSAFYYDYKDLQVSIFIQGTAKIVNAAQSKIYGLDAQFRYDFSDAFQISAGGTWVHARNKEFTDAPIYTRCTFGPAICGIATFIVVGTNLEDTTMQRTPKLSGNIGATYRAPVAGGELVLSGNLSYTSKFFFGPSGIQFPQKGYELLSLRAQWNDPSERYFVALWGDNLTDSKYYSQVQYNNPGIGANWGKPITYGIEFGAKF